VSYFETLKGKLLESPILRSQAAINTREQFSNSPNLGVEMMNAVMDAMDANQAMSRQVLNSETLRARLLTTLLGPGQLWEALRGGAGSGGAAHGGRS
jgi:type I restriction enzyme, R subunit